MKKLAAFILLLCHINNSMFFPQVQEEDVYDSNGFQLDDINSLSEFISVELGYDKTADDEDTDDGQNFHPIKTIQYDYQQPSVLLIREAFVTVVSNNFKDYKISLHASPVLDITTPPPDQA